MCGAVARDHIDLSAVSNALIRELSLLNDAIGKQGALLISDAKESDIGKASVPELQQHDSTLQEMSQRIQAMQQEVSSMRQQVRKGPRLEDLSEKNKK